MRPRLTQGAGECGSWPGGGWGERFEARVLKTSDWPRLAENVLEEGRDMESETPGRGLAVLLLGQSRGPRQGTQLWV